MNTNPGWFGSDPAREIVARHARPFLTLFLPLAAIAAVYVYFLYQIQVDATHSVTRASERQSVRLGSEFLGVQLSTLSSDLLYISNKPSTRQWIGTNQSSSRRRLQGNLLAFARQKGMYDQIRLIDVKGNELIRINNRNGRPRAVTQSQLQNKSGRYYFKKIRALKSGQIYLSPLDLNIENGEIEQPIKPVIRAGTPLVDQHGNIRGAIVINLLGAPLIDRLHTLPSEKLGQLYLLNKDGYWLRGPRPELEWGFMRPEGKSFTIENRFPGTWQQIKTTERNGQLNVNGDLFTFTRLPLARAVANHSPIPANSIFTPDEWVVLTHVPQPVLASQTSGLAGKMGILYAGLVIAFALIAGGVRYLDEKRIGAQKALAQSETQIRTLVESAPDAILICDADGLIKLVNAQVEQQFGYQRSELIGQPVEILMPDKFRDKHPGYRRNYLAQPKTRPMGIGMDLLGRRRDGSEFPVEISLSPMRTEGQDQVVCIVRDTTLHKQSQAQILQLNTELRLRNLELESLNSELEAFSYSVSHDLRAPLRTIDGFSRILVKDYSDQLDESGLDKLNRVRKGAQHMAALIDDLLKLSRVTLAELNVEEVDISEVAKETAESLREQDSQREATISIEPGLKAKADPRLVRIVVDNLLGNAWKFTANKPDATIRLGANGHNGESVFYVRDNGAGFDPNYASKLFGAFQRLHDPGEYPGTGIGLATVHRIVRKHGGRIWAEGKINQGATFHFTLGKEEPHAG